MILPKIVTDFDGLDENSNAQIFRQLITNTLSQILPAQFFDLCKKEITAHQDIKKYFQSLLPLVTHRPCDQVPGNMSCFIIAKCRPSAFKFFMEMVNSWLIPGKRLNGVCMFATDFSMPDLSDDVYTLSEVVLRVENLRDLETIQKNLPIIETEISLGVASSDYARRILEIKGLTCDEKTAMIQEYIAHITSRLSKHFSNDVYTEMQHVLVMCRDEFKAAREVRHLSRIICVQYLFRKELKNAIKQMPDKRHLSLKLFKAKLKTKDGEKTVLSIIVGVNFLRDKEIFEEAHLIKAVQNYIPEAKAVAGSFFYNRRGSEPIGTLYLDVEKSNQEAFTGDEIQILRRELPSDLEGRIEQLIHPVFMPRNEEEVMRNILTLSNQIKYLKDLPQVFITFDEQTHEHLYFTVIVVRVINVKSLPIRAMYETSDTAMEYIHDSCKTIGFLRKKYRKEATVFRIKVAKDQFLRRDYSIDLYKARQSVVTELSRIMGEIRDYNGGMIFKQNELLNAVRELLKNSVKYNELLLENFFFSLTPVTMRTVLEPKALKKLFLMLLELISEGFFKKESVAMKIRSESNFVYAMIGAEDHEVEEEISRALAQLNPASHAVATACVTVYDRLYIGYIYRCDDAQKQKQFCSAIEGAIEVCRGGCKTPVQPIF